MGLALVVALAACGGGSAGETTSARTTEGATATVQPQTSTSGSVAERFDASASCELTTELTEGPFYFDVDSIRSDIREDREGTLLRLGFRVRDAESCEPIDNAVVDIWHCDALGAYSGFESASAGGGGGGRSDDETYLRGAQVTNQDGIVEFKTVYPGWYRGRTVHIHVKVHLDKQTLLTTQVFTNREFDDRIFSAEPYSGDTGRDTYNVSDGIYDERLQLSLEREGKAVSGVITFDVRRS